jgi:ABC-type branched-subunit amino acid transport system permease subunit
VAFVLGALILRVRGNRFVIVTVAFAEIMRLVAHNWVEVTRGQMGPRRESSRRSSTSSATSSI